MCKYVPKKWGHEEWIEAIPNCYITKYLYITKGCRTSLQYHESKTESMLVTKGKLKLTYLECEAQYFSEDLKEKILEVNDTITFHPMDIHRLEALEDSIVFEVSDYYPDDIKRLEDDYGRT